MDKRHIVSLVNAVLSMNLFRESLFASKLFLRELAILYNLLISISNDSHSLNPLIATINYINLKKISKNVNI